jgi:hypothetical protein
MWRRERKNRRNNISQSKEGRKEANTSMLYMRLDTAY